MEVNQTISAKKEFLGFDFDVNGIDIISNKSEILSIYNDGSGLTGDFSEEDTYFDDDMKKADEELNNLLKDI